MLAVEFNFQLAIQYTCTKCNRLDWIDDNIKAYVMLPTDHTDQDDDLLKAYIICMPLASRSPDWTID